MGFFNKLAGQSKGIDEYVDEARQAGIPVIDVREAGEYARGHIPGAVNVPLGNLGDIAHVASDKAQTLYVHCLSGSRSGRACKQLNAMGYKNTVNIGGINAYRGNIERS